MKSYVFYRMTLTPIWPSVSEVEGHFNCLKPFWLPYLRKYSTY